MGIRLSAIADQKWIDELGFERLGDRYVVAVKEFFGQVGDMIDILQQDGTYIKGIIGDNKGMENSDKKVHYDGSVVEFLMDPNVSGRQEPNTLHPEWKQPIVNIDKVGNYFNGNLDSAVSTPAVTSLTSSPSYTSSPPSATEVYKNGLNKFIEEYYPDYKTFNQEEKLWQMEYLNSLAGDQNINGASIGHTLDGITGDTVSFWNGLKMNLQDVYKITDELSDSIVYQQQQFGIQNAYREYSDAKQRQDMMMAYYNKLVAENADPEVIEEAVSAISSISDELSRAKDSYSNVIKSVTDHFLQKEERALSVIEDRIRAEEKLTRELDRQIAATDNVAEQYDLISEKVKSNREQIAAYQEELTQVHQDRWEYQNTMMGNDDYRYVFEHFDIDGMFNDFGEANYSYYQALEALSLDQELSRLGPILTQIISTVGQMKKAYGSAREEIDNALQTERELKEELVSKKVDTYVSIAEKSIEALDYRISKQEALIGLLEKENDMLKTIRTTRRDITSELQASMDTYDWIDKEKRELLFNEHDYRVLNRTLISIQSEVQNLYRTYVSEINDLSQDEWYKADEITAAYERQLSVKMESYELAQKDLELAKKRTEYDNIIRNKNQKILVGGRWVNTPDLQALYNASKELYTLEQEKADIRIDQANQQIVRSMEGSKDIINTEKLAMQERIDVINNMTREEKRVFSNMIGEINVLVNALEQIRSESSISLLGASGAIRNATGKYVGISSPLNAPAPSPTGTTIARSMPDVPKQKKQQTESVKLGDTIIYRDKDTGQLLSMENGALQKTDEHSYIIENKGGRFLYDEKTGKVTFLSDGTIQTENPQTIQMHNNSFRIDKNGMLEFFDDAAPASSMNNAYTSGIQEKMNALSMQNIAGFISNPFSFINKLLPNLSGISAPSNDTYNQYAVDTINVNNPVSDLKDMLKGISRSFNSTVKLN